jgi:hypothetical protein
MATYLLKSKTFPDGKKFNEKYEVCDFLKKSKPDGSYTVFEVYPEHKWDDKCIFPLPKIEKDITEEIKALLKQDKEIEKEDTDLDKK